MPDSAAIEADLVAAVTKPQQTIDRPKTDEDAGIARLRRRRGLMTLIGNVLGIRAETVSRWKSVPLEYVFQVAEIAKLPPELLRPDFFMRDPLRRNRIEANMLQGVARRGRGGPPITSPDHPRRTQ